MFNVRLSGEKEWEREEEVMVVRNRVTFEFDETMFTKVLLDRY